MTDTKRNTGCGAWIAGFVAVIIVAFVAYQFLPAAAPPLCATQMSPEHAKELFVDELRGAGYSTEDATGFKFQRVVRDDENSKPTYFATFAGTVKGIPKILQGIGDGCAFTDLVDLTPPNN